MRVLWLSIAATQKLEMAKEIGGADFTLNTTESEVRSKVDKITNGEGVDVVLDTVGLESTINLAVDILNKNGAIVIVGLFGKEITTPLFQTVIREYQVYGSLWGNYNESFVKLLNWLRKGKSNIKFTSFLSPK